MVKFSDNTVVVLLRVGFGVCFAAVSGGVFGSCYSEKKNCSLEIQNASSNLCWCFPSPT